jgi:hypothetical protein
MFSVSTIEVFRDIDAPDWLAHLGPTEAEAEEKDTFEIPHDRWFLLLGILFMSMGATTFVLCMVLTGFRQFFYLNSQAEGGDASPATKKIAVTSVDTFGNVTDGNEQAELLELITKRRAVWPATVVGLGESFVYPIAIVMGKPDFLGFWVALKLAAQWKYWDDDKTKPIEGRTRFYVFLLGNLLSIISAVVTARFLVAALRP